MAIIEGGSHAWGQNCTVHTTTKNVGAENFARASIWSTQKNPENHAKQIRRIVDNA